MIVKLEDELRAYAPFNPQEEADRALILRHLLEERDVFTRKNATAHMTASAWVVNATRTKVLMAYHNLYNSWAWLGGHADGERDLMQVALREVQEESGLADVRPVLDQIYSLEILTVDGHVKHGAYVPSHLHLNVTYLLEADEGQALRAKLDENRDVAWFEPEKALAASTEPWFREHVYAKLNQKLQMLP